MDKIKIGKIVNAVGLRGELKVINYSDEPDRFETLECIYIKDAPHTIENVRYHKGTVILKVSGVEDRTEAERLKQQEISMSEAELEELPEGQYYIRDLIGAKVVLEDGTFLGELTDVLTQTAQDLYEIKTDDGKKVYLPGVDEFLLHVDIENHVISVRLPQGLLDL